MAPERLPVVTAVIPCFNAARYIGEAVDSVIRQSCRDIEIVVVDDGSTDALDEAIAPFRDRITVIRQPNSGQGAARNRGIAAARGVHIAFLDADDRWLPDKIARQLEVLAAHPHHKLVHTGRTLIDSEGRTMAASALAPLPTKPAADHCLLDLIGGNTIIASSVLASRELFEDEPFATDVGGVEDWDMWVRLAARTRFAYVAERLTEYRVHDTNFSWDRRVMAGRTVTVMDRVLRREPNRAVRRAARAHRREAIQEMAHIEYESGNYLEARRWFHREFPYLHLDDIVRYGATYLPDVVFAGARAAWRTLRAIERHMRRSERSPYP